MYLRLVELLIVTLIQFQYGLGWSRYHATHMVGNRTTIVQLFEWRFDDVAAECERFLGPMGYGAVQVSPVHEHIVLGDPVAFAWYQRYQTVSYKIISRSGTEAELKDMIERCDRVGVKIYVDLIINHMTGGSEGHGLGGTSYNGKDAANPDYPGVPYKPEHFNLNKPGRCPSPTGEIRSGREGDKIESRNCMLSGLRDLDQGHPHVQHMIAQAMNELTRLGVAGFRVDAMKHMWPEDMEITFKLLEPLDENKYGKGAMPFIYHEIAHSQGEISTYHYIHLGRPIEFLYLNGLQDTIKKRYPGSTLANLKFLGHMWDGFLPDEDAVVLVDNHDVQRSQNGIPDHVIMFRQHRKHKQITCFMLAWPYGVPKVMSSYNWPEYIQFGPNHSPGFDKNKWMGPPSHPNGTTKNVPIKSDGTCDDGWICEHRWRQIANMVGFRNVVGQAPVSEWWDNGKDQIAFSRQQRGFFAMNNEYGIDLRQRVKVALQPGTYCDIISGELKGDRCTGKTITVDQDGYADIFIGGSTDGVHEDPILATHILAKLN